jgi:hypothetical protein
VREYEWFPGEREAKVDLGFIHFFRRHSTTPMFGLVSGSVNTDFSTGVLSVFQLEEFLYSLSLSST